jgi:polar amino acid transport system substrate-binding protein
MSVPTRVHRRWRWLTRLLVLGLPGLAAAQQPAATYPDLRASLGLMPRLVDSAEQGAFVELVRALDAVYPGRIEIRALPHSRSIHDVLRGAADFHLPALRDAQVPDAQLPYRLVDEKVGTLASVLYSNVKRPLTERQIAAAIAQGGEFPYLLEAVSKDRGFPHRRVDKIKAALLRLNLGRIDGFIHPQEEADALIVELKLKHIRRELYSLNDDVLLVSKDERGEQVNRLLSESIRELRASGELERLYRKIHGPFVPWQPCEMGW